MLACAAVPRLCRRLDPWYVTGFAEGDGAFTYSRSGRQLALYFAIKLPEADRELLANLQDFFHGAGRIYRVVPRLPRERSGFTKTAAYYRVCRREDLERIVAHFDRYPLRGAKAASYRIWRRMVVLKRDFRRPDRALLDALAARLSSTSPRNAPWTATGERSLESNAVAGDVGSDASVSETPQLVSSARPTAGRPSPDESSPQTPMPEPPAPSSTREGSRRE
jgi:LAGLIDADG endonuclease